jgi:dihydrodipicolinate synthase/N-acetylneuraminate lyase
MKRMDPVRVWSAAPTPLTADLTIDLPSVDRMIRDAIASGIQGVFLAGTCGEGPWLPDRERIRLVQAVVAQAKGTLKIAVQVTDNSVPRILDNIRQAAESGADYAIIAAPSIFLNATPDRVVALFVEAINASPIPVGIYDLGRHRPVMIPEDRLTEIYRQPNVHLVKDSSGSPARRAAALEARAAKPGLQLFNGDEFRCFEYLEGGYDGFMFGGACAAAAQLHRIAAAFRAGNLDEARRLDAEMKQALQGIYGGEQIACWLTGLKYYMVRRGLFASTASYLGYPLTDACRAFIQEYAGTAAAADGLGGRR